MRVQGIRNIGGRDFEVVRVTIKEYMELTNICSYYQGYTLSAYYNNPSEAKRRIWKGWKQWALDYAEESGCYELYNNICVSGANSMSFSIMTKSVHGVMKITKSHNYLYVLF